MILLFIKVKDSQVYDKIVYLKLEVTNGKYMQQIVFLQKVLLDYYGQSRYKNTIKLV